MADPTTQDLRDELKRRTDVAVPPPPVPEILAAAASAQRNRARRVLLVAAAGVALIVGVGATIAATTGTDDHVSPSKKPTQTHHPDHPENFDDLPSGKSSDFAVPAGRTLYQNGKSYEFAERPIALVQVGEYAVVQFKDGRIEAVDVPNGRVDELAQDSGGTIVAGHNGEVAWVKTDYKTVVVHNLETWNSNDEREQRFPVDDAYGENPLLLYGITADNLLIAGRPGTTSFAWNTRSSGSRASTPRKITGLGSRPIVAVTPTEIVLMPNVGDSVVVGQLEGDAFVTNERVEQTTADFNGGSKYFVTSLDGSAHVIDRIWPSRSRGAGRGERHPERDVHLTLPPSVEFIAVHWEFDPDSGVATHVLLDVPASNGLDPTTQVRCDVRTGDCQVAGRFAVSDRLAAPEVKLVAGEGVTTSDLDLVSAFVAFARSAGSSRNLDVDGLPLDGSVLLGLGPTVQEVSRYDLEKPAGWRINAPDGYAGRVGAFSPLEQINGYLATSSDSTLANRPLNVYFDDPPGCAGAKPASLDNTEAMRRITIQPGNIASCLDWFSIDLYVSGTGRTSAIVLDLREP